MLHSTSKRSTHFKLLSSLMNPSFDTQPASFLQQFNAWKEQVVRYQQLSGENLPDFIKLTAVVNGLKGQVRHHVLMQLDGGSSFGDLDSLLQKYFNNTYVQSESSLNSVWDKAWRDNQAKEQKGKGKVKARSLTHTTSRKVQKAKEKEKAKAKESLAKEKGKLTHPSLHLTKAKGSSSSFPRTNNGAAYASKRGILHKLAGGIRIPTSSSISTRKEQLGQQKASSNLHKLGASNHLGLSKLLLSGLEELSLYNGLADLSLSFTSINQQLTHPLPA